MASGRKGSVPHLASLILPHAIRIAQRRLAWRMQFERRGEELRMAMFLGEIAFLLSLALIAAGLVLWHQGRQGSAPLLRVSGGLLVAGAVLAMLCTSYSLVRYRVQGELDHAYPMRPPRVSAGPGRMGWGMLDPDAPRRHEGMREMMRTHPWMGRAPAEPPPEAKQAPAPEEERPREAPSGR
jgi:hypothetical protein